MQIGVVENFGSFYFLLKIKLLAERKRELFYKICNCMKRLLSVVAIHYFVISIENL